MIHRQNLSLLANHLAKAGKRIPEEVLERDYCLAWFLVALSRTPLRERLVFKGGTAIKRLYFGEYRFSEDLDFTLTDVTNFATIREELEIVFAEAKKATGAIFRFARADRATHENSYTFYLAYEGPLPLRVGGKEVKVDITIREQLVFAPEERPVLRGYEQYADLPPDATIRVYSLDEIAIEKVVALMDSARNEPRDLYDIWYLVSNSHVQLADLREAVQQKLRFRGRELTAVQGEFRNKEQRFKKLWDPRLSHQVVDLPEFTEVYRMVRRALRQASLVPTRE